MKAYLVAAIVLPILLLGWFLHLALAASPKRVELRVEPHMALAPASIAIMAHVPRDPTNRQLDLECSGVDYYRASSRQIDGDLEPTTQYPLLLRDVPEGDYLITARLLTTEHEYNVADRVELHGRGR